MLVALLFTLACAAAAPIDIPIGAVLPGPLAGAVAMTPDAHRDATAAPVLQDNTGGGPTSTDSSGGGPSNNGLGLEQGGMRGVPEAIEDDMKQISG